MLDKLMRLTPNWYEESYIALENQFSLINRNPKYMRLTTTLFLLSNFNPVRGLFPGRVIGIAPGINTAYHFCRVLDDITDGVLELPRGYASFNELKTALQKALQENEYPNDTLGILLRGTIRDMKEYYSVDLRNDILHFLDAMEEEHERRMHKTISSQDELLQVYQNSFRVPQDIAFISLDARVRSTDIPELAELQGRIYALRDLDEELPKGAIFIPKEALPKEISSNELLRKYQTLPEVAHWKEQEMQKGRLLIGRLKQKKLDWRSRIIVNFTIKGLEKFVLS